jgi:hypothetical protein
MTTSARSSTRRSTGMGLRSSEVISAIPSSLTVLVPLLLASVASVLSRYFEASLGTMVASVAGMDHRRPFPFKYSKRANVLLALVLLTPIAAIPAQMFRDLFRTLLKIVQSGGKLPP